MMKLKLLIILTSFVLLQFTNVAAQVKRQVSEKEAIQIAEKFVAKQKVYKDVPSNALIPKAIAVLKMDYKGKAMWYVTFKYGFGSCPECPIKDGQRVVRMNLDGTNVRLGRKSMPSKDIGNKF